MGNASRANSHAGEGGIGFGPRGIASYIDVTVVQGALGGLVVLVLAVWGKYVLNRLWQRTLLDETLAARETAVAMGLILQPLGYGPRIRMKGQVDGEAVSIEWSGGMFGQQTVLRRARQKTALRSLRTAAQMEAALLGEE